MRPPYQTPPAALIAKIRRYIAAHLLDNADLLEEELSEIKSRPPHSFEAEQKRRDLDGKRLPKEVGAGALLGVGLMVGNLDSLLSRLKSKLDKADETFSERLLRLIDERGMTDVEAYKRAGCDRKLFSKIRTDRAYQPKPRLVYAFIFALRLNLDEARDLLASAGYSISHARQYDLVMEFCITEGYDLDTVNGILYKLGMDVL